MSQVPWQVRGEEALSPEEAVSFLKKSWRALKESATGAKEARAKRALLEVQWAKQTRVFLNSLRLSLKAEKTAPIQPPEESGSVFKVVHAKGLAVVAPFYSSVARLGVIKHLSKFLFKFVSEFEGIWMAFSNLRPANGGSRQASALGYMLPDLESTGGTVMVEVEFDALVFTPRAGCLIREFPLSRTGRAGACKTQLVRPSHLRLCFLEMFPVVVHRDYLHRRFRFCKEGGVYIHRKDDARRIGANSLVRVRLLKNDFSQRSELTSLQGCLLTRNSGPLSPPPSLQDDETRMCVKREAPEEHAAEEDTRKHRRQA